MAVAPAARREIDALPAPLAREVVFPAVLLIGRILGKLARDDLFIITGDHGNDPTIGHDKHTREFTPLLVRGDRIAPNSLAPRDSLADIAATIAEIFGTARPEIGKSFLRDVQEPNATTEAAVSIAT